MKTKFLYILLVLLLFHLALSDVYAGVGIGNKITISGVVKDQSNEPIIGASIILKVGNSSSSSVSDVSGRFNISANAQGVSLFQIEVSSIGYKSAGNVYSVSSLKEGKGIVTVKMLEDSPKNKKKSSEIVAQDFSISSSNDYAFSFQNPTVSSRKTPQQLYNEANNYYYGNNGVSKDDKKAFELYSLAAERGNAEAQGQLGYLYDKGEGIAQNKEKALFWYRKSANQGNMIAQCNLGIKYEKGDGVEKDYTTALYWYKKSADQGLKDSQFKLGYFYAMGLVPIDYKLAMQWYLKAAEQNHALSMHNIAIMYERGQGVPADKSKALAWYNKAIEHGDDTAKQNASNLVSQGIKPATVTLNSQMAVTSFKLLENDLTATTRGTEKIDYNGDRAALIKIVTPERGFAFDGGALGIVSTEDRTGEIWVYVPNRAQKLTIRHSSHGVLHNYYYPVTIKSGKTYEMVLQTGNQQNNQPHEKNESNYLKGLDYYIGQNGVKSDAHIAFHYMKLAADQDNNQEAYCLLAQMYENGLGVEKDFQKALSYYERGTKNNDPFWSNWALANIAMMHYEGRGTIKNVNKAKQMLQSLAQENDMLAEYYLGSIYLDEKNYKQAILWYNKSADQGSLLAYNDLGYMYLEGEGVKKDYTKALNYFTTAIDRGFIGSKCSLGRMYENGWGVIQDISKAVCLIREAADFGSRAGQYHLGRLYENGIGIKRDMLEAISWYRKSAEKNYEKAQKRLQELEELMAQGQSIKTTLQPTVNSTVKAQSTIRPITQASYMPQKRFALIIGNGDYEDGLLANPVNDAKDIRSKLIELGFEVMGGTNMKKKGEMMDSVRIFCTKAIDYDAVLFFYSGHARQDNGINYLIPTRTDIQNPGDIVDQCLSMSWVVDQMQRTGAKNVVVLLDACRNAPPIQKLTRDEGAKGLADMLVHTGTFIGFATRSGAVALDGHGQRNSPYTAALLKMLNVPGLNHVDLFNRVKKEVYNATGKKQMPTVDDQLVEDFIFNQKR